jgi:hypothetical protein
MTTVEISDAAWREHNFTWRNNRGAGLFKRQVDGKIITSYITFGIPDPPRGKKPDNLKGGDRVGWTDVIITPEMVGKTIAVFTSLEIKGPGDVLDAGQKKWHNLVLEHGGISEIWYTDKVIRTPIK